MQLETPRLILREFVPKDWSSMAAYWAEPRYNQYYPDYVDRDQFIRNLVSQFVSTQSDSPRLRYQLAVTTRDDDRFIGNCGIRINDSDLREANIGYELDPSFWGQGYATEAAGAILAYGFEILGMHRIWADCVAENAASARVLTRLGLRQEAHFREHRWHRDRWWDTLIFAILDHEHQR